MTETIKIEIERLHNQLCEMKDFQKAGKNSKDLKLMILGQELLICSLKEE